MHEQGANLFSHHALIALGDVGEAFPLTGQHRGFPHSNWIHVVSKAAWTSALLPSFAKGSTHSERILSPIPHTSRDRSLDLIFRDIRYRVGGIILEHGFITHDKKDLCLIHGSITPNKKTSRLSHG